jgi:predicted nuclease of restriction endonuclease-like (RecB) superfamily
MSWRSPQQRHATCSNTSTLPDIGQRSVESPRRRGELATEESLSQYEEEALRGGWSVRQLDRQISTLSFQRSRTGHLKHGSAENSPDSDIKDPFVLEFLGLKDEYSESELEDALIRELEQFLLELGNDFAFIARQKRLRVGTEWYRVNLLFFHRRLRSLIVVELKLGKFTHADAGYGKPDVMKSAA